MAREKALEQYESYQQAALAIKLQYNNYSGAASTML